MAITLMQAKVGMTDKVDAAVVDMFRRSSQLLDKLVTKEDICFDFRSSSRFSFS